MQWIVQEQQSSCTSKLQKTTGLIQFCIEALKETDNAAFLQVSLTEFLLLTFSHKSGNKQQVRNAAVNATGNCRVSCVCARAPA